MDTDKRGRGSLAQIVDIPALDNGYIHYLRFRYPRQTPEDMAPSPLNERRPKAPKHATSIARQIEAQEDKS